MEHCKKCGGEGEFYTPDGMRECHCKDLERKDYGLPKKHSKHSFGDFVTGISVKDRVVFVCEKFVSSFDAILKNTGPCHSLLLMGMPGSGRTMLASICGWAIARSGKRVTFWNEGDLMTEMKAGFKSGRHDEIIEQCTNVKLLILDDLGNEKQTDFVTDTLNLIVNRRYQSLAPMLITSNLTLKEIGERYGERMQSRLGEMCVPVVCAWEDYRKNIKNREGLWND